MHKSIAISRERILFSTGKRGEGSTSHVIKTGIVFDFHGLPFSAILLFGLQSLKNPQCHMLCFIALISYTH